MIVCTEFEIIILWAPESILHLPNTSFSITLRSTVVGTKGTGQFLCVFLPPRILDNTVINLQKGRETFSRKIPASYKYCKIVKIAMYFFKHTRIFRVFGKKTKKIKVEYIHYINSPFLEIKILQMFNV